MTRSPARVEQTARFDRELNDLRVARHRIDEAVEGLHRILQADPAAFELIPGTQVRCAVTRPFGGADDVRCVYHYDESEHVVELLSIAVP